MAHSIKHVLVIAPAGRVDSEKVNSSIELLRKRGIKVELGQNVNKVFGPFAGMDAERLSDLDWALNHPEADTIWMARGGYGMTRILDWAKMEAFQKKPKMILGYSDITALFLDERFEKTNLVHSSMMESLSNEELEMVLTLFNEKQQSFNCKSNSETISLKGEICGGNLSLIVNQLGIIEKDFFKNKILLLEEVAEYDYKIDRMFTQLKRSGILKNIKALLLGAFSETIEGRFPMKNVYESIIEISEISGIPCIYNLPIGHIHPNHPLLFNTKSKLKYSEGILDIKYLF